MVKIEHTLVKNWLGMVIGMYCYLQEFVSTTRLNMGGKHGKL
jgi:hypothetical protein